MPVAAATAEESLLPPLRDDLGLYPGTRTITGAPTWVIYDPARHRYFNIGRLEFEMLKRWQPVAADALAQAVNDTTSLQVNADHIAKFSEFLSQSQLVQLDSAESTQRMAKSLEKQQKTNIRQAAFRYLFIRVPLFRPDRFLDATLPWVQPLVHPVFLWFMAVCGLSGIYLVSRQWESFLATFPYFFSLEGMAIFVVAMSISKIGHELGHAYTAKHYGLEVSVIGVALLVFFPIMYTDTSSAWQLTSRRQRLWIGAAGMLVELSMAVFATLLWSFLPDGPLRSAVFILAAVTWLMTLFINLNPFMQFDGYYILSDIMGINNMRERSYALARWRLREWLFGFGEPAPEYFSNSRRRKLILYAYGAWLYRLMIYLGIGFMVYHLVFKLLGIILVTLQLTGLIGRALGKEMKEWWKRRDAMRWNIHTISFVLVLTGLIALLATPWQSRVSAPAVYRTAAEHRIYTAYPGRIETVAVYEGQQVKAGDTLLVLDDPELHHKLAAARNEAEVLRLQLDLQSANQRYLERSRVLEQELAETRAKITGYQEQLAALHITAPISGQILQLADGLRAGRWIPPALLLGLIVNHDDRHVLAYVNETDVGLLTTGRPARFYPELADFPPFDAVITEIDAANYAQLQTADIYVSVDYGGELAARRDPDGGMVPEQTVYRLRLKSTEAMPPAFVQRGTVRLETVQRLTLLERAWLAVSAVLIRESGF